MKYGSVFLNRLWASPLVRRGLMPGDELTSRGRQTGPRSVVAPLSRPTAPVPCLSLLMTRMEGPVSERRQRPVSAGEATRLYQKLWNHRSPGTH